MPTEDLIAALDGNKRLNTPDQVAAFDRALQGLAQEPSLTTADLNSLFRVFDDSSQNEEVMFGLVHFVEDLPLDDFLRGFVMAVGRLDSSAPGWAKLFHYRILNSDRARGLYSELVTAADEPTRRTVSQILRAIVAEEGPPLKGRAEDVITRSGL